MDDKPEIKLSLLLTGNEIVSGDIVDTNSAYMAKELASKGISIRQMLAVGDRLELIINALLLLARENDIVIVNGGLGSTVDDLTSEAASSASGRRLMENPRALEHIESRFAKRSLSDRSKYFHQFRKQAMLPEGAEILDNPVGLAVGFKLKIEQAICYFTPGVPREMRVMLGSSILPDIQRLFPVSSIPSTSRFQVVGIGESQIQQLIHQHVSARTWDDVQLGFRAGSPCVEVKLSIQDRKAEPILQTTERKIQEIFGDTIFSREGTLPETIVGLLRDRNKRMALVETCTGGLLSSMFTTSANATEVFEAGYVTRSDRSIIDLLQVPATLVRKHGAVSREVARQMVVGALKATRADYALAVTGGTETGGNLDKTPGGAVFIGWGDENNACVRKLLIKRDWAMFQQLVCAAAMDLLRRHILQLPTNSFYYFDDCIGNQA
ncbi:MAG: CinA family nicotinamide mononucleotide deamidase-related protein [Proteobacteria bacterium]|nr:CinA family nicotinamide mononucleotide deamidase-related protein [Pseudomonadota bacterium]